MRKGQFICVFLRVRRCGQRRPTSCSLHIELKLEEKNARVLGGRVLPVDCRPGGTPGEREHQSLQTHETLRAFAITAIKDHTTSHLSLLTSVL